MQGERENVSKLFFDIRDYFEISVFEISRIDCTIVFTAP